MAMFMVSYDLHNIRNYDPITSALTKAGAVRLLESLWLWSVNDTAIGVRDALQRFVDGDDSLAVIEIKAGSGWASVRARQPGVEWLKMNVLA